MGGNDEKRAMKKRHRAHSKSRSISPSREERRRDKKKRHRERSNERNRSRERDRSNERNRSRERDRSNERNRSRERDRSNERNRSRERDRSNERNRSRERDRSNERKSSRKEKDESNRKGNRKDDDADRRGHRKDDSVAKVAAIISQKALTAERDEAERAAEQAALEEEMRKRRERVRAWQLEKAARLVAESNENSTNQSQQTIESSEETNGLDGNHQEENNHDRPHWTLEDDDEDEGDGEVPDVELEKSEFPDEIPLGPIAVGDQEEQLPAPFVPTTPPPKLLAASSSSVPVHLAVVDSPVETAIRKPATSRFNRFQSNPTPEPIPSPQVPPAVKVEPDAEIDPLDAFMASLYDSGDVIEQNSSLAETPKTSNSVNPFGSNFITLDQIMGRSANGNTNNDDDNETKSVQEWESEIAFSPAPQMETDMDVEREERERREFLEALKAANVPRDLDEEMVEPQPSAKAGDIGRIFAGEGDLIDESEMEAKKKSALDLLEEAKRAKELKPLDHSTVEYIPFRKNLYIMPRALARLAPEEVALIRGALQIKVRGKGCPAPVENWDQCGLSERILSIIAKHNFEAPFSIQKQAIPAIMCGRDLIAVAKTGSGKTLAFLLPLFRHILDQPPLRDGEGPIGLIMAPARELAFQITNEAKKFTKALGLRVACIYGGAGVAEQIAELKRGADIVVCTPGRMIDILCMQAGKLVSLRRVTFVVLDEADRMFDMGFEPQIRMILSNVRPDRQTVLFSATFPKQIEKLAKSILQFPLEIVVGERTTVNKDITQYIEVHEEEEKFMRLLQLLGLWYERGSVLIFVDKQEKCDQLFQDLLKSGYPCLSLHGGKDQLDRDHTLHEFKTGIKTVMVATSVAGRGLDVPDIICVINYNCPNHVEDYVHRVGRTGRAGRKGVAYTFLLPSEDQYAPMMKTLLEKAQQPIPEEIEAMAVQFKEKVEKGEAHWISSGFVGKGYTFDASEMNEAQKLASMQRKAYEIEQGIVDEDLVIEEDDDFYADVDGSGGGESESKVDSTVTETVTSSTPLQITDGATVGVGPTPSSLSLPSSSSTSTEMTPLEKARALAQSLGFSRSSGAPIINVPNLPPPPVTADGKIDTKAALNRARIIAAQMTGKGITVTTSQDSQSSQELHFMEEFEINDYPPLARRKVTQRSVLDEITERTSVAIISRGSYIPPGKKLEIGDRKLYLLIEGSTEMQVKQARMEIQRLLDEETIKLGAPSLSNYGKYGMI